MRVAIEGNIGCGKTTLLNRLFVEDRHTVVLEPVNEWAPWLSLYYSDVRRWGTLFNIKVLHHFHGWAAQGRGGNNLVLFERSPLSNRHVFAELHRERSDPLEFALYEQTYDVLGWKPDAVIYLRTNPMTCLGRKMQRARECEAQVGADYIAEVHERYEALCARLVETGGFTAGKDLFVVDGNRDSDAVTRAVRGVLAGLLSAAGTRAAAPM